MNLFQIQERLKNYSQDQLVNEMRAPSGSAPQYLILSELQRRKRMMTESQAQPQQEPSVAEEAVASAGVPQGGLAQMAQALAPQTDMVQNTARMFGGGSVGGPDRENVGLPEGTNAQDVANFIKQDPNAILGAATGTDPFGSMLKFIANGMTDAAERQASGPSRQVLAQQMNAGPTDARMAALEQYKSLYGRPTLPVRGMSEGGLSGISPRLTDFMPIGPSSRRASGRGIAITPMQMGQGIYEDYIDEMRRREAERRGNAEGLDLTMTAEDVARRANQNRYDPADANPPTVSARDVAALANADPISLRGEAEFPTMAAGVAGPYTRMMEDLASTPLSSDGMQFGETPIGSIQRDRTEEPMDETLQRILRNSEAAIARDSGAIPVSSTYDEVPFRSARAAQPNLADDARAARTAAYVEENLARDARGLPERTSAGMSDAAMAATAGSPFDTGFVMRDVFTARGPEADNGMGEDLPFEEILRMERERLAGQFEDQATQDEANLLPAPMTDNELANLELAGFDATDQSGGDGIGFGDIGRAIGEAVGFGDAMQVVRENEAAAAEARAAEAARAQEVAASFENEAQAADREIAALPTRAREDGDSGSGGAGGSGGGAGGGAGDGAGGGMGSSDDQYEQDKWLALAQFGLGLMSSQAPTFGQAIGDAGQAGIQALLSARAAKNERDLAAQTRADRLAAAARSAASETGRFRDDEVGAIDNAIGELRQYRSQFTDEFGTALPGSEETLARIDAEIETYRLLQRAAIMERFPELYQPAE